MDTASGENSQHARFSPGSAEGWLGGEAWPMARMLAQSGVALDRMLLIRWDRLPPLLGARWAEVEQKVSQLVQALAHKVVGAGAVCMPFERCSVLLVLPEAAGAQGNEKVTAIAAEVRHALFGALHRDELIETWAVRAIDDSALVCDRLAGSAAAATDAPPPAAEPPAAGRHHSMVLGDTDFSFFPLWEVRRNFVFFYVCEPFWTLPDGTIRREEGLPEQFTSARQIVALDIEVLRNVIDVLADVMEHDRMAQMLVPVHYSTLIEPAGASRYAGELRRAAEELAERAFFEIIGIPADVSPERLAEIVAGLRGLCRGVCVRIGFTWPSLQALADARVFAIGLDLRSDNRREAEIIADLEAFAARASALSLSTYAHGIRTTSLGVAATCAGMDFVGTEALAATLEGCALDDYVIRPIDLYKRIIRRKG
jgi:hypothetical protein